MYKYFFPVSELVVAETALYVRRAISKPTRVLITAAHVYQVSHKYIEKVSIQNFMHAVEQLCHRYR